MAELDLFEATIRQWLSDKSGLALTDIWKASQSRPKGSGQFIEYKILSSEQRDNLDEQTYDTENGLIFYSPARIVTVEINIYDNITNDPFTARNIADTLRTSMSTEGFLYNYAEPGQFGVRDEGIVNDLTAIEVGNYKSRALFSPVFDVGITPYSEDLGYFDTVVLEGQATNDSPTENIEQIIDINVEVTK